MFLMSLMDSNKYLHNTTFSFQLPYIDCHSLKVTLLNLNNNVEANFVFLGWKVFNSDKISIFSEAKTRRFLFAKKTRIGSEKCACFVFKIQ